MEKNFDINENGFSIRCKLYYGKDLHDLHNIVIATYGFGGNKDNKAISKFAERLISKYKGYGIICFDWPCHGKDARNKLILDECMTYLDMVTAYAKEEFHADTIFNYSSSFGAYVTLRYLNTYQKNPFHKIAFRCPAIKMYDAINAGVTEDEHDKLAKGKEIIRGFDRKIKLTQDFFDDLRDHDVSKEDFLDYADSILMIHGTRDEMAPIEVSREFSENNVIELIPVENADHPFSNPTYMDFAIQKIISFFGSDE
jgi:predicted alpha/beta-fold hydrolase